MRISAYSLSIFILILKLANIFCDEECTTNNIGNLKIFNYNESSYHVNRQHNKLKVSDDGLNLPLPYRNESERFQVFYEQVLQLEKYVIEMREYYDGLKNIGVTYITSLGFDYIYYSYIDSNEFIYTSFGSCSVYNLSYYVENDTPFHIITVDGKPQIATPLNLLSHGVHKNIAYLGSKDRYVRGIPVRQWLACTQLYNTLQSVKVIISYSNSEKWSPAFQKPGYESIPVHIDLRVTQGIWASNPPVHDQFNIFDFRPGPFREELLYVPPGHYCANRYLEKKFPTIPKSFSFISNIIEVSQEYGKLRTFRNEYDLDKHLIKMDYVGNNKEGESRVANLNSKIQYNINKITGSCTIAPLNKSQELEFDLFRLNEEPPYEYIGQREIKGVKTDVWITYRVKENFYYMYYEWYFLANGWDSMNLGGPSTQVPFLLIIYDTDKTVYEISDFRANTFNTYNIDLSACTELERKHLSFSITDEKNYEIITKNKIAFKEATLIALEKYAKISVVRISKLNIIYDSGVIRPKFTLLDKTEMSSLDHELDLDESYFLLTAQINNRRFNITFKDSHKKEITVQADSESLVILEQNYAQTVYSNQKPVSSGLGEGLFIGLIIAGVFIGILFGVLSGLYYHNRKLKKESPIQMMSLKNPNDNL